MSVIIPRKILGDCRASLKTIGECSVHCSVSSPPYWGMRSYLPDAHPLKHLEIGSEPTLELYLDHIVEVYRGVHRTLRDDGLIFVNIGDRYTSGGRRVYDKSLTSTSGHTNRSAGVMRPEDPSGLKKKDLCMLPARVAMALQADGWYLRSQIPWIKRNGMPESADDRPGNSIEYVYMLSKSPDYFYDREGVKMPVSGNSHPRSAKGAGPNVNPKAAKGVLGSKQNSSFASNCSGEVSTRNRRNTDWFMESWQGLMTDDNGEPVALVVNPKGTTIEHFASYPPLLVEPLIRCATSDGGCCSKCGASWLRVMKDDGPDLNHQKQCGGDNAGLYDGQARKDYEGNGVQNASDVKRRILAGMRVKKTIGYKPACNCSAGPAPCVVLDPFGGTGCTAMVATNMGRASISLELNDEYFKDSSCRDGQSALHLL